MFNLRMFTVFMAEKYAYAWFNLISCHSVQKEITKKVKKYFWRLSCCVNCLVASGYRKRTGSGSFLKCVVRNVILSIDANFIVVARYYGFVRYHIEF